MQVKESTTPPRPREVRAILDGSGDLWVYTPLEDAFVSPDSCLIEQSQTEIETAYGISELFYEGDEITVIL